MKCPKCGRPQYDFKGMWPSDRSQCTEPDGHNCLQIQIEILHRKVEASKVLMRELHDGLDQYYVTTDEGIRLTSAVEAYLSE